MPKYAFSNLNHLGERFATTWRDFDSDEAALAYAKKTVPPYPLEVHFDGRTLAVVPTTYWRVEEALRRFLG